MQLRRDLSQAYTDLGEKAFELADRGDLSHAELNDLLERVRGLKRDLDSVGKPEATAPSAEGHIEETPPA